jgi:hypothetical protein
MLNLKNEEAYEIKLKTIKAQAFRPVPNPE